MVSVPSVLPAPFTCAFRLCLLPVPFACAFRLCLSPVPAVWRTYEPALCLLPIGPQALHLYSFSKDGKRSL